MRLTCISGLAEKAATVSGVEVGPEPAGWEAHVPSRFPNVASRLLTELGSVIGSMGAGATSCGTSDATTKGAVKSTGSAVRTAAGISTPCGFGTAVVTPASATMRRVVSMSAAARDTNCDSSRANKDKVTNSRHLKCEGKLGVFMSGQRRRTHRGVVSGDCELHARTTI